MRGELDRHFGLDELNITYPKEHCESGALFNDVCLLANDVGFANDGASLVMCACGHIRGKYYIMDG